MPGHRGPRRHDRGGLRWIHRAARRPDGRLRLGHERLEAGDRAREPGHRRAQRRRRHGEQQPPGRAARPGRAAVRQQQQHRRHHRHRDFDGRPDGTRASGGHRDLHDGRPGGGQPRGDPRARHRGRLDPPGELTRRLRRADRTRSQPRRRLRVLDGVGWHLLRLQPGHGGTLPGRRGLRRCRHPDGRAVRPHRRQLFADLGGGGVGTARPDHAHPAPRRFDRRPHGAHRLDRPARPSGPGHPGRGGWRGHGSRLHRIIRRAHLRADRRWHAERRRAGCSVHRHGRHRRAASHPRRLRLRRVDRRQRVDPLPAWDRPDRRGRPADDGAGHAQQCRAHLRRERRSGRAQRHPQRRNLDSAEHRRTHRQLGTAADPGHRQRDRRRELGRHPARLREDPAAARRR